MTCHDVRDRLDDYVDGALAPDEAASVATHLAGCASCEAEERALHALLSSAAALSRERAPERDLWPGIAGRLRPNVASFPRRVAVWRPATLAAAAAVLVALSSAVTWRIANRTEPRDAADRDAGAPRVTLVALTPAADLLEAEREYARATSDLVAAIEARRDSFPPEALVAVEQNIRAIDEALRSLREALRNEPDNDDLTQLLAATHKRKLDTLRRVVRLSRI
jgi:tetratricopeptide (TPR) repeat protein